MKVFLASDHAGVELKSALVAYLSERKYDVEDLGPATYVDGDDYPDFMRLLADAIAKTPGSRGIGLGKSGEGEAMALNRRKGVRATAYYGGPIDIIRLSRLHNDANALSLGAGFLSAEEAKSAVLLWLTTAFSGEERHARRIKKLDD